MLAAVLSPFLSVMEDGQDDRIQGQMDSIALMIDTFYESDADSMTLYMDDILPSVTSSVTFDGNLIRVTYEDREYVSGTRFPVSHNEVPYNSGDIIKFIKTADAVKTERIN